MVDHMIFAFHLPTDDPAQPDVVVTILSDWWNEDKNPDVGEYENFAHIWRIYLASFWVN